MGLSRASEGNNAVKIGDSNSGPKFAKRKRTRKIYYSLSIK